jgi:type II secretory pathway component PulK
VVIIAAAMVAASMMYRMRAEMAASMATRQGEQAWQAAMAGLRAVEQLLVTDANNPQAWHDRPELLGNQVVGHDGSDTWRFTVYAPSDGDDHALRFGVSDLAGRISVNDADERLLSALPDLTPALIGALLDYRDADSEQRPNGAEREWYEQLPSPATLRNGPLASVEELLAVRGFTAAIVYGEDANLNGLLDANEDDGDDNFPTDDGDGRLRPGLRRLLATQSVEPDTDSAGEPRLDLNGDLQAIANLDLPQSALDVIRRYRQDGHRFTDPSQLLNMRYVAGSQQPLPEPGDDAAPDAEEPPAGDDDADDEPRAPGPREPTMESGIGVEQIALVLDRLTVATEGGVRRGRINVMTAEPAVLACVPGIDEDAARQIVEARAGLDENQRTTCAWLLTLNILDDTRFKRAAPHLTTRSGLFHVQCVGFGLPSGRFRVIEAVLDLSGGQPRVVYLRDLTRLGLPFPLSGDS